MKQQSKQGGVGGGVDWEAIRKRGELFPAEALDFVRDGLARTVELFERPPHAPHTPAPTPTRSPRSARPDDHTRHVTGRELCQGLRHLAIERYGMLARTVLRKWGIVRTEDFGAVVYTLIDRGELRSSEDDSLEHFRTVYDFDEAFPEG